MKKLLSKILKLLLIAMLTISLSACSEDDDEETNDHSDAWADAFIKKSGGGANIKYGINLFAGASELTAVTVTTPDENTYELSEYWKGSGNMRRQADTANDTETSSSYEEFAFGDYTFTMTFSDGATKTIVDTIDQDHGDLSSNAGSMTYTHKADSNSITINFDEVPDAHRYMIQLVGEDPENSKPYYVCQFTEYYDNLNITDGSGYLIHESNSDAMDAQNADASCSPTDSGWKDLTNIQADGAQFFAQVGALRFESTVDLEASPFSYSDGFHNRHMIWPVKKPSSAATW